MALLTRRNSTACETPQPSSSPCCADMKTSCTGGRKFSLTRLLRKAGSPCGSRDCNSCKGDNNNKSKVKSLYRRPSTSPKPGTKACSSMTMKRKQFANRFLWLNQSVDCDDDNKDSSEDECMDSAVEWDSSSDDGDPDCKQYCRKRAQSSASIRGSILKKSKGSSNTSSRDSSDSATTCKPSPRKQTSFKENVEIFYYDGVGSSCMGKDSAKLRLPDTELWCEQILLDSCTGKSLSDDNSSSSLKQNDKIPLMLNDSNNQDFEDSIFQCKKFVILQDSGLLALRLIMCLKDNFSDYVCTVKALSSGHSLTITIDQPKNDDRPSTALQITEKVALPLKVDPITVRALVNRPGFVAVDAHLVWTN